MVYYMAGMDPYGGGRPGSGYNQTPWEKQVLSTDRACAEFGLEREDLEKVPCTWRCYMNNNYPVWRKGDLQEAKNKKVEEKRAEKRKADEEKEAALLAKYGEEGLRELKAKEAAAEAAAQQEARKKREREQIIAQMPTLLGDLEKVLPGAKAPEVLPTGDQKLNKTNAKKRFYLTDTDLKKAPGLTAAELLAVAHAKHGKEKFDQKRRDAVEKEVAPQREKLMKQLEYAKQQVSPEDYSLSCKLFVAEKGKLVMAAQQNLQKAKAAAAFAGGLVPGGTGDEAIAKRAKLTGFFSAEQAEAGASA